MIARLTSLRDFRNQTSWKLRPVKNASQYPSKTSKSLIDSIREPSIDQKALRKTYGSPPADFVANHPRIIGTTDSQTELKTNGFLYSKM